MTQPNITEENKPTECSRLLMPQGYPSGT